MKTLLLIIGALFIIIASPFVSIWALNTLFPFAIPYTFKTWLAAFLLAGIAIKRSSA